MRYVAMRLFPDEQTTGGQIIMSMFLNRVLELMTLTAATGAAALPVDEEARDSRLQFIEEIINLFGKDVESERIKKRIAANLPRVMTIKT